MGQAASAETEAAAEADNNQPNTAVVEAKTVDVDVTVDATWEVDVAVDVAVNGGGGAAAAALFGVKKKIVISRRVVVAFGLSSSGGRPRQRRGTLRNGRTGRVDRDNRKLNCCGLGW